MEPHLPGPINRPIKRKRTKMPGEGPGCVDVAGGDLQNVEEGSYPLRKG